MNNRQRAAISAYTGNGYWDINGHLRHGKPPDPPPELADLDELFAQIPPSGMPVTLYRGTRPSFREMLQAIGAREDMVITDKGFISASRDFDVALRFAREKNGGMVLMIRIPAGSRFIDLAPISNYPDEEEVLLPRGTALRLGRYNSKDNLLEMDLVHS